VDMFLTMALNPLFQDLLGRTSPTHLLASKPSPVFKAKKLALSTRSTLMLKYNIITPSIVKPSVDDEVIKIPSYSVVVDVTTCLIFFVVI
jgi:hypothetical protein